jgi:acetyl-CoA carboxylase carboxyl transferase subunit beta
MSWLEKLLPPKITPTDPTERRSVPEGLWIKCPSCEAVLYKTDLEENQNVCPQCSHHHRIGARARGACAEPCAKGEGQKRFFHGRLLRSCR